VRILSNEQYQNRVEEWLEACFPPSVRENRQERTHRFLEEALELAQANECSKEDALSLVEYVYSRPKGKPELEVGGVLVTLASLCSASQIDMNEAGDKELKRNWERINTIRRKQASKPHGSPLPQ
jgi:NTP pyrophosphatase (non-canonical NTP hydrolase)